MLSSEILKIRRGLLAGLLFRPFGFCYWGLEQTGSGITFLARAKKFISFPETLGPAKVTKIFGFAVIGWPLNDGSIIKVAGIKFRDAANFASVTNDAWRKYFIDQFSLLEQEFKSLSEIVERLENPRRFPSACLLSPFLEKAIKIKKALPEAIPENVLSKEQQCMLNNVLAFQGAPENKRNAAIKAFIESELTEMRGFFDTIESKPLTPEQRLAVATDEDATLVLASAGSGKTSVIVSKAAYLIERNIRQPNEILLMAFGKDAAAEMALRIKERTGATVNALTFHALGYEIIREVEGGSPALAAHAADDAQFQALLRDILINDVAPREGLGALLVEWFSEFYWPYKSRWDFKTKDEYYQYVESHELRTLNGELVKSFEEWEIANWLYRNGIAYQYEPDYEHELPENERRSYTPDFRLTDSGVYIEHFGVRKSKAEDGSVRFTTAPYVDRESYLEGMAWKRKVHKDHGTTLIETYSYEREEGRLTEALHKKLAPYIAPAPLPHDQVLGALLKMGQVDSFSQTIMTFLRHFKGSKGSVDNCRARAEGSGDVLRSLAFLKIFESLIEGYQKRLGDRIDFEDMIVRATEYVTSGRYQSPYRHLLVDEFQDISCGRAHLLRALKAQHADARIFAVGDDWQSIYRFAGADIHLMRDFGAEFGGTFAGAHGIHSVVDLGRTFRSVDKIALPARHFVLQNPSQIEKSVIPAGTVNGPAIKVAYYDRGRGNETLRTVLDQISANVPDHATILLLGRYHFVKPTGFAKLNSTYPKLSIRFMTVHGSKGLEADHVIILRAAAGQMGFPTEVSDDPLLNLILPESENFVHAEERRLFYVALTRARKSVTILADREEPSAFVRELIENKAYGVPPLGEPGIAEHRCGVCNGRMLAQTFQNSRITFSCEHSFLCGQKLKPCDVCGKDLPIKKPERPGKLVCSCGAEFPSCPECPDGWLVKRKGRYGDFLGCIKYPGCTGTQKIFD